MVSLRKDGYYFLFGYQRVKGPELKLLADLAWARVQQVIPSSGAHLNSPLEVGMAEKRGTMVVEFRFDILDSNDFSVLDMFRKLLEGETEELNVPFGHMVGGG